LMEVQEGSKQTKFEDLPLAELIDGKKTSKTKGGCSKILVCTEQYLYHKNRDQQGKEDLVTRWRCRSFPDCRATATTITRGGDLESGVTRLSRTSVHEKHLPNSGEVTRLKAKAAVLRLAKGGVDKPRDLFTGMNIVLAQEGEVNTTKKATMDRQVHRLRAGTSKPFNPTTFEEVCRLLPEHLKLTTEGSQFVAFCGTVEDGGTMDDHSEEEEEQEEVEPRPVAVTEPQRSKKSKKGSAVAKLPGGKKSSKKSPAEAGSKSGGSKKSKDVAAETAAAKKKKGPAGLIVLLSQHGVDRLSMAKLWMADGNAKLVSDPFSQLYIVLAAAPSGRCIPSAWVFMTHRTVACYKKMYLVLKAAIGAVRPSQIVLDMEVAAYKAFLKVFFSQGNNTTITFCLFHWRRALLRKLGELHCREEFFKKGPLQKLFSRLSTLPFVPADHIIDVGEHLLATFIVEHLENISEASCDFLDYFRKNYLGTVDEEKEVRKPARFPPHLWSIYTAFLNCEPFTTNYAEGYNNGAGHSLSRHATLEASLLFFQGEEAKAMGDWRLACREAPNSFDSTNATNVKTAQKKHRALSNILLTFHKYTPDKYWEYLDLVFSV